MEKILFKDVKRGQEVLFEDDEIGLVAIMKIEITIHDCDIDYIPNFVFLDDPWNVKGRTSYLDPETVCYIPEVKK